MKILLVRVVIVAPVVLGTSWTTRKFLFGRSGVLLVFLTPEWFWHYLIIALTLHIRKVSQSFLSERSGIYTWPASRPAERYRKRRLGAPVVTMARAKFEDLLAFNAVLTVCRRAQKSKLALKLMEAMLGFTIGGGSGLELWASIYLSIYLSIYIYIIYYICICIYLYTCICVCIHVAKKKWGASWSCKNCGNHMNVGESLFVR